MKDLSPLGTVETSLLIIGFVLFVLCLAGFSLSAYAYTLGIPAPLMLAFSGFLGILALVCIHHAGPD